MKKLLYLLFLLPLALLGSCSDDDDLAQVDMTVTMSNVTQVGHTFYAIKGSTVKIDGTTVKPAAGKQATIVGVNYYMNGLPMPMAFAAPYAIEFTADLPAGSYILDVTGEVLQVDKSITNMLAKFPFTIVETEEDLPEGAPEIGTYSSTITSGKK